MIQVTREEIEKELRADASKPLDAGADVLPFDHLSGRRFELLAYLLLSVPRDRDEESVTLVKSTGDRGRDLLRHRARRLFEIVQCKNQRDPITRPELAREILKVALHWWLDRELLPEAEEAAVSLAIWCPGGFSEPAASLIDTWPQAWTTQLVSRLFQEVVEKYKGFKALSWTNELDAFLVQVVPARLSPTKVNGLDISRLVRAAPEIYRQFFSGHVLANLDDVKAAVEAALQDSRWRHVGNEDCRSILDRLHTFPEHQRIYFGFGYAFGLSEQLVADMRPEQMEVLLKDIARPVMSVRVLMEMIPTKANAMVEQAQTVLMHSNRVFPYVLYQTLTMRALAQVGKIQDSGVVPPSWSRMPELQKEDLWDLIDGLCGRAWDDFSAVLSPAFVPPTKDAGVEALRTAGARHAIRGYASKSEFVDSLRDDCRTHLGEIRRLVQEIEAYFPRDFLVVADSKFAFTDPTLTAKLGSLLTRIATLRLEP
jgi:hypothetical protein